MQKIEIIGNLVADAEMVQGKNGGEPFVSFKVICNEKRGDADFKTTYDVTGKSTGAFQFLKTGKKVYVCGMPASRAYLNKEGAPASRLVIRMHALELL